MLSSYNNKEHWCDVFFPFMLYIKVYKNSKYIVLLKLCHYTLHTFVREPVHTDVKCIKMYFK